MGTGNASSYSYKKRHGKLTPADMKGRGLDGRKSKAKPLDPNKFQGMTLKELEDASRNLARERMFILDNDGNVVKAYQGGKTSVSFADGDTHIDGAVVTHNHPQGVEGYGATFSEADVLVFANSDWAEFRASASGQGEYNYIMRRTQNTTRADSTALFNRVSRDIPTIRAEVEREANRAMASGSRLSARAVRQIYTGVLTRYWSSVLPQYNFEYIPMRNEYNYTQTRR